MRQHSRLHPGTPFQARRQHGRLHPRTPAQAIVASGFPGSTSKLASPRVLGERLHLGLLTTNGVNSLQDTFRDIEDPIDEDIARLTPRLAKLCFPASNHRTSM